ncbi:MAG: hypothetical protein ACPIOQ_24605, partial [Promethearchaeia archaeon]
GVVTGEELPPTLDAGYGPTTTEFQPQGAPTTTVGLPPTPPMATTIDVPNLTILPDEEFARAKAANDADLEKIQADKAADPEYAPEDAEAAVLEFKRAFDAETQRRAEAEPTPDAESAQAPEGAETSDAPDEAPVAPKIRVHPSTRAFAQENDVDIEAVFAGERSVSKKKVEAYIKQRAADEVTSDPIMVDAEGTLSKIASDVETAGGDVTDTQTMMAEFEAEIADIEKRETVVKLYKESREFAEKQHKADQKAAGAAAPTARPSNISPLQQRRINAKKRNILENDPNMSEEDAEAAAMNSIFGAKEESVPSNYGETRGGSTTARAGRALEEGTEAAGKSIEVRTDVGTGEKYYSVRTAKMLRRGFSVGDGRTVINKSDVPTRGTMPRDEAMARAQTNLRDGSGPTVIAFTAKMPTRAFGSKMIERGETGYADAVSGKIFANRADYEKTTGRAMPEDSVNDELGAEDMWRSGAISAAEAAALIRQHEANQAMGAFNSLHTIPTRKGNLVAAIRFIPDGDAAEVRVIGANQEDAEIGVRAMISKKGGPEGNPANWELRYVARPAKNSQPLKKAAFKEAEPGETLEQAAITPRADGTEEGGAPHLSDIAE